MTAWATIEQLDVLLGSRADDFTIEEKQAALDLATATLDAMTICDVEIASDTILSGDWTYNPGNPPPAAGQIRDDGVDLFINETDADSVDHATHFDQATQPIVRLTFSGSAYLFSVESGTDEGTYRRLVGSFDRPPSNVPNGSIVFVEWLTPGLPSDARFQLATATLASQLLTAAPVVVGGTITSESLGDYRYTLDDARSSADVLDVGRNPSLTALIGWCLPQQNYSLTISRDYVATCDCASFGVACDCRYSAHGYGCPCPIDYRSTHYPYPARSVRA